MSTASVSPILSQEDFNQEVVSEGSVILDTPFYQFRNSDILAPYSDMSASYLYVTGDEADSIRANNPNFVEEKLAFYAATEPHDELIAIHRLESVAFPGSFLYVRDEYIDEINRFPESNPYLINQGVAFYAYEIGSEKGIPFTSFTAGSFVETSESDYDDFNNNIRGNFNFNLFEAISSGSFEIPGLNVAIQNYLFRFPVLLVPEGPEADTIRRTEPAFINTEPQFEALI